MVEESMSMARGLESDAEGWLSALLAHFKCQTGTLHRADGEWLDLVVEQGVPEFLIPLVTRIPFGKGIAGVAASTGEPVELCNLQKDLGGVAKEGAKDTKVAGSLAVPIFSPEGNEVVGTLGIGKHAPYEFTDEEKERLAAIAADVAKLWK